MAGIAALDVILTMPIDSRWKPRPIAIVGLGLIMTLSLVLYLYHLLFPRTLANDAHDVLHAVWQGDSRRLYGFLDPNEVRVVGWTPDKLDAVIKRIVTPAWRHCHDFRPTDEHINESKITDTASQGVAEAQLTLPDGAPVSLGVTVMASDDGGKTGGTDRIISAWWVSYLIRHGGEKRTLATSYRSELEGCQRDGAWLKGIGIPGIYDRDSRSVVPWEKLEAGLSKELAEYEAKGE